MPSGEISITTQGLLGIAAGGFALADIGLYILAILGRDYRFRKIHRTVPNRATWVVWTSVGFILASSYSASGATDTVWFAASYALGFLVVSILSFPHGEGGLDLTSGVCIIGTGLSGWAWWWFNSPEVALFSTIAMDVFGAIPTVKKSWVEPSKENRLAWSVGFLAALFNMAAIDWQDATFAIVVYPVYMLIITGLITCLLSRKFTP